MKEYRVVEMNLSGANAVEDMLNDAARDGWQLVAVSVLSPLPSARLFLERDRK